MTTRIPSRHTILAATILALLAGCGGSQSDGTTQAKTSTDASGSTAPSSSTLVAGQDNKVVVPSDSAASGTTDTSPSTDSGTSDSASDNAAPRSISSEQLAVMLLQGSTWNGDTPEYRVWPAWPWQGDLADGHVDTDALAHTPAVQGGQWLQQVDEPGRHYRLHLASWLENGNGFAYPTLDTGVDLEVISQGYYLENYLGRQYTGTTGKLSLALGNQVQVQVGGTGNGRTGSDAATDGRTLVLEAATSTPALTPGQSIPLGQPLGEWRNSQGDSVKLVLLAGTGEDQLRICLDQAVQGIQRLTCTLWQIADDTDPYLQPDPAYRGLQVVDAQDGRQRTWLSSATYPAYTQPTLSAQGVRGDVLAGVLAHYVDIMPAYFGPVYQGWSGVPWNGPGPDGQPLEPAAAASLPSVEGWSNFGIPGQARADQTHFSYRFENFLSHDTRLQFPDYPFTAQTVTLGLDMQMGRAFDGYTDETGSYFIPGRFLYGVDGVATPGRTLLTLSPQASFFLGDEDAKQSALQSATPYTLRAGEQVPFGQVLQRWQDPAGNQVGLMVLAGRNADEFRLCLDQQLPDIKRLSCSHWRIPAGWKLDVPPDFKGISVADDRSTVGGNGTLYWQTSLEARKNMKRLKARQYKAMIRQKALQQP